MSSSAAPISVSASPTAIDHFRALLPQRRWQPRHNRDVSAISSLPACPTDSGVAHARIIVL
jgi:hypothetical protein